MQPPMISLIKIKIMSLLTYNLVLFQNCMTLYLQFSGTDIFVFVHTMTVSGTKTARLSMYEEKIFCVFQINI